MASINHKNWINKYRFHFILSLCLIVAPFLIYLHLLFDDNVTTLVLFGYKHDLKVISVQTFVWILLSDLASIVVLGVIYLSIGDKWKYAIILPLLIYMQNLLQSLDDFMGIFNSFPYLKYIILAPLIIFFITIDFKYFENYRKMAASLRLRSLILTSTKNRIGEFNRIFRLAQNKRQKVSKTNILYSLYTSKISFEHFLSENKLSIKSKIFVSSKSHNIFWTLLILFSTSFWFLHYLIPNGAVKYTFWFVTITDNGFSDAQVFMWFISRKIMIIIPAIIWFFTYHSWWRYAILSPLILYLFQFWEVFQGIRYLDAYTNIKVFPLVLLSILLVVAMSRVVRQQSLTLDTYEQISMEIDFLIKKLSEERSGMGEYRSQYRRILDSLLSNKSEDTQLAELTRLQQELQGKIGLGL